MEHGWNDLAPFALVFGGGALVAFPIYFGLRALVRRALTRPAYCLACGSTTIPKPRYRGSFLAESALWDLLVVPGVLYSGWRHRTRRMACAACGSEQTVPPDSPAARADAERRAVMLR